MVRFVLSGLPIVPAAKRLLCFCFAMLLGMSVVVRAQENSECMDCHEDETLQGKRDGQKFSVYIAEEIVGASVHKSLNCIECHSDLKESDFPHKRRLAKVNCTTCHEKEEKLFADSLHGRALASGDVLAPRCQSCHGKHDILPVKDRNSNVAPPNIPFVCGSCHSEGTKVQIQRVIHEDHILENFSESIHGEGLLKKGLTVSATCVTCHSAHHILPHTDPRSLISRENVAKTCETCHAQIERVHRKIINGKLWQKSPESIPVCIECHQPHKVRKALYPEGVADMDCLVCHNKPDLKHSADGRSLFVDAEEIKGSIHTKVSCAQCHTQVTPARERACETITTKVNCAICHTDQVDQYQQSMHGKLVTEKNPNAPTCLNCHGTHAILGKKNLASPTFPTNVPKLCSQCHREEGKAAVLYKGKQHDIDKNYAESIHGRGLLESGLVVAAMCTSCHTAHKVLPASDPASSVNRHNIAATCAHCHKGVYEKFQRSVHFSETDPENKFPVCNECHTAHTIKRTDRKQFNFEIMDVCGKCHLQIAETYFDTFHGKVSKLGFAKAAKCHDCHGSHDISKVTSPTSPLSPNRITTTCQKCHPSAGRRFAGYLTHATHHDPQKYPWVYWTFWSMTALLVGTFVVSGVHTLLWLPRSLQMRRAHPPKPYDPNERQYVRFKLRYRILHGTMIVSFLTLAITGMTLKFSYTAWAMFLSWLLGGFEVTGTLHRAAALVLVGVFCYHISDLIRRKRSELGTWKDMLFGPNTILLTPRDIHEVWATLKWYVGKGPRPMYGRWTYWEKFDYFAVFWGIAIIGSSGLMLWFPEYFTFFLPGWLINVATIVHSDEALLAAGFIFTIHFFNTHFRPEKFPMDTVIFSGRMSLEDLQHERPLEYQKLVAENQLEANLAAPMPPATLRTIKFFAWIALVLGIALVIGILYAMIFAYN